MFENILPFLKKLKFYIKPIINQYAMELILMGPSVGLSVQVSMVSNGFICISTLGLNADRLFYLDDVVRLLVSQP